MHINYVLFLAAGAFFASAQANSIATDSTPRDHLLTAEADSASNPRLRKTTVTAPEADEEKTNWSATIRDIGKKLQSKSGIEKAASLIRPKKWKEGTKPLDNVFAKLKGKNKLFAAQRKWTEYLTNADKPDATLAKMMQHGSNGDLYNYLSLAKKVDETKELATQLQRLQLEKWLKNNFNAYTFNTALKNVYKNTELPIWTSHEEELLNFLIAKHGNQELFKLLEGAKLKHAVAEMASALQLRLVERWKEAKVTSEIVSMWMGLKIDLKDPNLIVWVNYMESLLKLEAASNWGGEMSVSMNNSYRALFSVLMRQKDMPAAKQLREQVFLSLLEAKVSPTNMFQILNAKGRPIDSPEKMLFKDYRNAFNKIHVSGLP